VLPAPTSTAHHGLAGWVCSRHAHSGVGCMSPPDPLRACSAAQFASLAPWLQEYMGGSSNELYEVRRFPSCMVGKPFREVGATRHNAIGQVPCNDSILRALRPPVVGPTTCINCSFSSALMHDMTCAIPPCCRRRWLSSSMTRTPRSLWRSAAAPLGTRMHTRTS
jgi:hypothetical protein